VLTLKLGPSFAHVVRRDEHRAITRLFPVAVGEVRSEVLSRRLTCSKAS
jgi:hypothetical protein